MAAQDRIDFRVDEAIKASFINAAEAYGMNLSNFMIAAGKMLTARAQDTFQPISLTDNDRDAFLQVLDQSERDVPVALQAAKKRRGKRIVSA